jgi:DNA-binding CsgD family transcriptional regulator
METNPSIGRTKEFIYYKIFPVINTLLNSLNEEQQKESDPGFKDNELTFIKLACTEMTYKEIADEMNLSPKTIDGYRNDLFRRLNIKNRVGLVIYALKHDLVKV